MACLALLLLGLLLRLGVELLEILYESQAFPVRPEPAASVGDVFLDGVPILPLLLLELASPTLLVLLTDWLAPRPGLLVELVAGVIWSAGWLFAPLTGLPPC